MIYRAPDTAPPWYRFAVPEIGTRELPGNRGPDIRRYIALAHCGNEGDPWCAIFVNAMLQKAGLPGTRSAAARGFEHHSEFVPLSAPALGAVTVFWRKSRGAGLGHVGFYAGQDDRRGYVYTLGGNQQDMVEIAPYPRVAPAFGLVGFFWPRTGPQPHLGAVAMTGGGYSEKVT